MARSLESEGLKSAIHRRPGKLPVCPTNGIKKARNG